MGGDDAREAWVRVFVISTIVEVWNSCEQMSARYLSLARRADRFALCAHCHLGSARLDNNGLELRTRPITGACGSVIRLRRAQPGVGPEKENIHHNLRSKHAAGPNIRDGLMVGTEDMVKRMLYVLACLSIATCSVGMQGCGGSKSNEAKPGVETSAVKDAKEAFLKMSQAIRAGNKKGAFRYISKKARQEIEASGQVDVSLNFLAGMNINHGEMKGDVVILSERKKTGAKGFETTTSVPIYMIEEDGQWKVGPSDSLPREW